MKAQYLPILFGLSVAACTGPVETRINSIGVNGLAGTGYSMDSSVPPSKDLAIAQKLVNDALRKKGYTVGDSAALNLEVTLSSRPAQLSLTMNGPQPDVAAKKKRVFQSCDDVEYRLGVVLTRVSDGVVAYQATAAEYHCKETMADALPFLVDAAMADIGHPAGIYAKRRKGRD